MKVLRNSNEIPADIRSVVSTGTFDGVHKGHQAIIKKMITIAKQHQLQSVIVTFEPHPRVALGKDDNKLKLLTTLDEKLSIFERSGIDYVFVIDFTPEFAATPYESYVKDFLVGQLKAKFIVLGFNHHFGNKRSGNHDTLIKMGAEYGYQVEEVNEQTEKGVASSSTKIRALLDNHFVEEANSLLSYHYSISGEVVEGKKIGNTIGFPTANVKIGDCLKQIPANGVYAVNVEVENRLYKGMCNIGLNPTFENRSLSIEVNIFDFERNIYGKYIKITFESFIRDEIKFKSVDELVLQLNRDKQTVLKKLHE